MLDRGSLRSTTALLVLLTGFGCSRKEEPSDTQEEPATAATATDAGEAAGDFDELPLGLDPFLRRIPPENPLTAAKVELGRHLYFDKRLSFDNSLSCASCHDPEKGWTDQEAFSSGIGGKKGGRSAPTVINRVFGTDQFWDGRASSLEDQALGPMTNPVEMGMPAHDVVVERVQQISGYKPLFVAAFGDETVEIERIAQAVASFERTIVSGNSPFDRYQKGDKSALSASAARGLELFNGKARCSICHAGFNLTDEQYHNIGVGMDKPEDQIDKGRELVTNDPDDRGKFKTPTLRNIAETFPYMHDGSEETLPDVVEYYDKGGIQNPTLDKEMQPLNLTDQEKKDLVAFMDALTGDVTPVTIPEPLD